MSKLTFEQQIEQRTIGVRSARKHKVEKESLPKATELSVHNAICKYLKLQYPNAMFMSDFAAGIKLSHLMASRQSNQKSNHSYPDVIIFEPRGGYAALFIELKRDRDALYNKDGSFKKSEHLDRQRECHRSLRERGFMAEFACGFDEARHFIDLYFKL